LPHGHRTGHVRRGVETAAEALARLARGDVPRLVLSAASLPDKAGIDLFREVSGRLGHEAPAWC
jgi:CheY-like chemotaxis protein